MQRKTEVTLLQTNIWDINVERKIVHLDGLQYYYSSTFQNNKFEVDFFKVLGYKTIFQEFELWDKLSIITN